MIDPRLLVVIGVVVCAWFGWWIPWVVREGGV